MEKANEHYYFDIKIQKRMDEEFNRFMYDFYNYIDKGVINNKDQLEWTNKYLYNRLLKDLLRATLNNYFQKIRSFSDCSNFSYEFTINPINSKNYITIDDVSLEFLALDVLTIPWIFLDYARADKNIMAEGWKKDVIGIRRKNKDYSSVTKQKDEDKALLEEYKKAVPWDKPVITQCDIYANLGIPRTTFESRCRSHHFKWDKKKRLFVDLKGNPI